MGNEWKLGLLAHTTDPAVAGWKDRRLSRPSSRASVLDALSHHKGGAETDLRAGGALPSRPFGDGRLPGGSDSFREGALPRILVAAIVIFEKGVSMAFENSNHDEGLANDPLLTVQEVAMICKVPISWVYERTRRRGFERIPHVKLGKYLRFDPAEIRTWLQRLKEN
jgi:predicted DNA-binding transcriptional regulator AlpA